MTKVKICGITNLEDALVSAKFGADALGFNFYEKSPRYIEPSAAREIIEQLPDGMFNVGVFVNESLERIVEISAIAGLDAVQLHGDESPEFVKELKTRSDLEIIKAFRVSREFRQASLLNFVADAVLLDAYSAEEYGGTGENFDWSVAKSVQAAFPKMYLAGGLNANNIAEAILSVQPYAADACSGLESSKGIKNHKKIEAFIRNAKNA